MTKLSSLGIEVPKNIAEVIVAAHEDYLFNTNEGRETIVNNCDFAWEEGDDREIYLHGKDTYTGQQVYFLKACVIAGDFVSPHQVLVKRRDLEQCGECGKKVHCTRLVKGPPLGDKINLCNHCLIHIDNSSSGGMKECERCPELACEHKQRMIHEPNLYMEG